MEPATVFYNNAFSRVQEFIISKIVNMKIGTAITKSKEDSDSPYEFVTIPLTYLIHYWSVSLRQINMKIVYKTIKNLFILISYHLFRK
jgi:hypothetical protein